MAADDPASVRCEAVGPRLQRCVRQTSLDGGLGVVLGVDVVVTGEPVPLLRRKPALQGRLHAQTLAGPGVQAHVERHMVGSAAQVNRRLAGRDADRELAVGEESAIRVDAVAGAIRMALVAGRDDHPHR